MGPPLDEILKMDGLGDLEPRREEIGRTLEALSLQGNQEYLSIGIGRNRLPLIVALHGLNVTGVDFDEEKLQYQREQSGKFAVQLKEAGGSLKLINVRIAIEPLHDLHGKYDYIECVNFRLRGEHESELAQILLNLGKPVSSYLIATWGGPTGTEDKTIQELVKELENMQKKFQIEIGRAHV